MVMQAAASSTSGTFAVCRCAGGPRWSVIQWWRV